jgi:hypothetical protein
LNGKVLVVAGDGEVVEKVETEFKRERERERKKCEKKKTR